MTTSAIDHFCRLAPQVLQSEINRSSVLITADQIGKRLREERKRLGLNQTDFAKLGHVHMQSQTRYEAGKGWPATDYLALLDARGVDVGYVLTGQRSSGALDSRASELLSLYLGLPFEHQEGLLIFARSMASFLASNGSATAVD